MLPPLLAVLRFAGGSVPYRRAGKAVVVVMVVVVVVVVVVEAFIGNILLDTRLRRWRSLPRTHTHTSSDRLRPTLGRTLTSLIITNPPPQIRSIRATGSSSSSSHHSIVPLELTTESGCDQQPQQ